MSSRTFKTLLLSVFLVGAGCLYIQYKQPSKEDFLKKLPPAQRHELEERITRTEQERQKVEARLRENIAKSKEH